MRGSWLLAAVFAAAFLSTAGGQSKEDDRITTTLPGLSFYYDNEQYSGFLSVPSNNTLHYWLLESQGDPSTDPLVLWLNGGPGCSSLVGMFTELGPFYPDPSGLTLFENIYSWNKMANIVFLESPRNVGFSYGPPNDTYNDDLTAEDNGRALIEFFKRYPEYNGRDFYITGESYGGVYVPMLVEKVLNLTKEDPKNIPVKFVGAAIGNGILSERHQTNSYVNLAFYRGITDYEEQLFLMNSCCADEDVFEYCNFYSFIKLQPNGDIVPANTSDPTLKSCGEMVKKIVGDVLYHTKGFNKYSHVQSCFANWDQYDQDNSSTRISFLQTVFNQRIAYDLSDEPIVSDSVRHFIDQGNQRNGLSSDQLGGFPCFNNHVVETYLNLPEVRKAIHVDRPELNGIVWQECNDPLSDNYTRQNRDTLPIFRNPLRILIYNGDADGVCEFLGDEWFAEELQKDQDPLLVTINERQPWFYQKDPKYVPAIAGFYKNYGKGKFTVDLVTVSGAGHYVPTFRPQQAFQMFYNFLKGERNYTTPVQAAAEVVQPQPLLKGYEQPVPKNFTRRQADQIFELPGATFKWTFNQHAGYLKGIDGNYLHYWLFESQANPTSDPLILWLNGGPGCSSLGGAMTELGPFHVNPDGVTLFENVYSWNRAANLLFLEAPRGVGFSWQDPNVSNDTTYSDELTIEDNYLAIKDFFEVHPQYLKRDFYVAAESYGGIYGPTLTRRLIDGIIAGDLQDVNLVGMVIGNGELSAVEQLRSNGPLMYHRGLLGKNEWDKMVTCCGGDYNQLEFCDVTRFVYLDDAGNAQPISNDSDCDVYMAKIVQKEWTTAELLDVYNIYQDCYQQKAFVFGSKNMRRHKERIRESLINDPEPHIFAQRSVNSIWNTFSTDNQGGFPCYASAAAQNWLNSVDVRKALHVPSYVQNWTDCNDDINQNYIQQYNSTDDVFDDIINSGLKLRILVYNGDLDLACNMIGDQWFIEKTAARNGLSVSKKHTAWQVRNQIAGYAKQFANDQVTIDLLTVKAALQMILNFISHRDFNASNIYSLKPKGLLRQYQLEEKLTEALGLPSPLDIPGSRKQQMKAEKKAEQKNEKQQSLVDEFGDEGITFKQVNLTKLKANFPLTNHYAGKLQVKPNVGDHLFYWFVESQASPDTDPVVLWLNGGPGCSSLGGMLQENGPFRPTRDGSMVVENLFSWNRNFNVLYLESPRGVGFTYPAYTPVNDETTTAEALEGLGRFFAHRHFQRFAASDFYITGESYGGVYVPLLAQALLESIQNETDTRFSQLNFRGFAIGNGLLSKPLQLNTAVHLLYYRGFFDLDTYKDVLSCCPIGAQDPYGSWQPCDFSQYVTFAKNGDAQVINDSTNATFTACSQKIVDLGFNAVWASGNSVYNTYQDCWDDENSAYSSVDSHNRKKRAATFPTVPPLLNPYGFIDQAKLINTKSSDPFGGYQCWAGEGTYNYLNTPSIQDALGVANHVEWKNCNDDLNENKYEQQNNDMTGVFNDIFDRANALIDSQRLDSLKILVYNGDADMACEYFGDEVFVYNLANAKGMIPRDERAPWNYSEPINETATYLPRVGGFVKSFAQAGISIDLVTIKGGGHFVPMDRGGPMLQVMQNWVAYAFMEGASIDFNQPLPPSYFEPQPITGEAVRRAPPSRQELDEVTFLPGLTFDPGFKHYSGYLKGQVEGNFLHYWYLEAQTSPETAPWVLWLTGGPGCSSLGALMGENGPFFVNPDGKTLFENVYSWNKAANVLYIESPRGVGFSYQNMSQYDDDRSNDTLSAADVTWALADFLSFHTELKDRPFYVMGESYGGHYIPTTTLAVLEELNKGTEGVFYGLGMNPRGFFIGNGLYSIDFDVKTMLNFYYFHGLIGKVAYDNLLGCCAPNTRKDFCDLTYERITPKCRVLVDTTFPGIPVDVYNIYQQCFESSVQPFGIGTWGLHHQLQQKVESMRFHQTEAIKQRLHRNVAKAAYHTHQAKMSYASTDANGGYQCYFDFKVAEYLNQPHVRDALHIPVFARDWQFCGDVDYWTNDIFTDMGPVFQQIMTNSYVQGLDSPFRILLHNGDSDFACDLMMAEYFVEDLVHGPWDPTAKNLTGRVPWRVHLPGSTLKGDDAAVGGWQKTFSFQNGKVQLQLLTVKGSGHFVPVDQPLPGVQLFTNFITNQSSVEAQVTFSLARKPLNDAYQPLSTTAGPIGPDPPQPGGGGHTSTSVSTGSTASPGSSPSTSPATTTKGVSGMIPALSLLLLPFFLLNFRR